MGVKFPVEKQIEYSAHLRWYCAYGDGAWKAGVIPGGKCLPVKYEAIIQTHITDIQFRSLIVSACSLAACCLEYMYTPKENFYVPNASHKHAQKVSLKFKNASDQILMTCFSDLVVTQSYFRYFTQFNELWQHTYVYSG